VKLLFDENLSHRLVEALRDLYPGSTHVRSVGLDKAADRTIWSYAVEHDYVIVTKDSDFPEQALIYDAPPKILWLQLGNCSTEQIEMLLRDMNHEIKAMGADDSARLLAIP
jgi:predicted nuclease of predicted toxin-antitoxin system